MANIRDYKILKISNSNKEKEKILREYGCTYDHGTNKWFYDGTPIISRVELIVMSTEKIQNILDKIGDN